MTGFPKARLIGIDLTPGRRLPLPTICAHCRWWAPHDQNNHTAGDCRKRAPELPPKVKFPETDAHDVCGDFYRHYTRDEWLAIREVLWPEQCAAERNQKAIQ